MGVYLNSDRKIIMTRPEKKVLWFHFMHDFPYEIQGEMFAYPGKLANTKKTIVRDL